MQKMDAQAFDQFIRTHREDQYWVVDVRTQKEYHLDHIPGSTHIPLEKIQSDPEMFDADKDIIFYCRTGQRSKVAAIFVAETGHDTKQLFDLTGGIMAYTGQILIDPPRVDTFAKERDSLQLMEQAIDLEKGAFLFYSRAQKVFKEPPLSGILEKMGAAEISHARSVFNLRKKLAPSDVDFDLFFNTCEGRILEGGIPIEEADKLFDDVSKDAWIEILDFAVELEYCAYDLYKLLAQKSEDKQIKQMFFTLAQAEKKHLSMIIQSFERCED